MDDSLSIDEQVPKELQLHFNYEGKFRDQISSDKEKYNSFGKVNLESIETILEN